MSPKRRPLRWSPSRTDKADKKIVLPTTSKLLPPSFTHLPVQQSGISFLASGHLAQRESGRLLDAGHPYANIGRVRFSLFTLVLSSPSLCLSGGPCFSGTVIPAVSVPEVLPVRRSEQIRRGRCVASNEASWSALFAYCCDFRLWDGLGWKSTS